MVIEAPVIEHPVTHCPGDEFWFFERRQRMADGELRVVGYRAVMRGPLVEELIESGHVHPELVPGFERNQTLEVLLPPGSQTFRHGEREEAAWLLDPSLAAGADPEGPGIYYIYIPEGDGGSRVEVWRREPEPQRAKGAKGAKLGLHWVDERLGSIPLRNCGSFHRRLRLPGPPHTVFHEPVSRFFP